MAASNRWLIGIGAALGGLVLLALVISLVSGGRSQITYAEDTPEGVLQRYLSAMLDGDTTAAYAYLSPDLQERCLLEEWRRQSRGIVDRTEQSQIVLTKVDRPSDNEAIVSVTITTLDTSRIILVPPVENSFNLEFFLDRLDDGRWAFTEFPWPAFGCHAREIREIREALPPRPAPTPTPTPVAEAGLPGSVT